MWLIGYGMAHFEVLCLIVRWLGPLELYNVQYYKITHKLQITIKKNVMDMVGFFAVKAI